MRSPQKGDMGRPKQPAFQFYTGDWLKDPELSACSPATRGIWADCVARMWESGRSGRLAGDYAALARLCRCSVEEMREAVAELRATKTATVTIRNEKVTLVNRRMSREAKTRKQNALRQQRHRDKHKSNAEVTSPSSTTSTDSPSGLRSRHSLSVVSTTSPTALSFPVSGEGPGFEWDLTEAKVEQYRGSYPHLDVMAECRKARQWCIDNPERRKTPRGMPRFLSNWLARAQDGSGQRIGSTPRTASPRAGIGTDDERREQIAKLD